MISPLIWMKRFLCKINILFSGDIVCTCAELLAADHLILLKVSKTETSE